MAKDQEKRIKDREERIEDWGKKIEEQIEFISNLVSLQCSNLEH